MPNHVRNVVSFTGKDVYSIIDLVNTDDQFDFEKIIPMPDDIVRGNLSSEDMQKSNGKNWYNWSIDNWGTKWNAYDSDFGGTGVIFSTAWSCPMPVFEKLSAMFPETTIYVEYADEDLGFNVGTLTFLGGKLIESEELSGTKLGYEKAVEINYGLEVEDYIEEYLGEHGEETLKWYESLE